MSACACCLESPLPRSRAQGWICGLGLAVLVNALLFLGVPCLMESQGPDAAQEYEGAVLLAASEAPPAPEQEPEPLPRQEAMPPALPIVPAPPAPRAPLTSRPVLAVARADLGKLDPSAMAAPRSVAPPAPRLSGLRAFEAGEVDTAPRVMRGDSPAYPYQARRQGVTGRVVVRFLVDTEGRVSRLTVREALPKGIFEDAVLEAVSRWRFSPGVLHGAPVNTWVVAPFEFKL